VEVNGLLYFGKFSKFKKWRGWKESRTYEARPLKEFVKTRNDGSFFLLFYFYLLLYFKYNYQLRVSV
jgi:hypothetical protein